MIQTGRHQKVPKTERFCPFCYGMIEDEIHFLINCKQYDTLFFFFFKHFFSGTKHPREDNPNLYDWAEITGLHTQTFNI